MIIIPEIVLFNLITGLVTHISKDFEANLADETKSLLYNLLHGNKFGKFDYYDQGKELFLRRTDHPRKVAVRQFFDVSRADLPTIHITLPGESAAFDGIGVDEGFKSPLWDDDNLRFTPVYNRNFEAQYSIIFTSENTLEVLLMYNTMRSLLISIFDSVQLVGLQNPKLGGQDLQINSDLIPKHIFIRALTLHSNYDVSVPRFFSDQMMQDIIFSGKAVQ